VGGGTDAVGCGGATTPRASLSARVTTRPVRAWTVSTGGQAGAYFSLKSRLPLMRVAPDALRIP
jgi:hypothetical protein